MRSRFGCIVVALYFAARPSAAVDYNFDAWDDIPVTEPAQKTRPNLDKPSKKDSLTTADVFELFKGEQKVAIVSKKEERVQDARRPSMLSAKKRSKSAAIFFYTIFCAICPASTLLTTSVPTA